MSLFNSNEEYKIKDLKSELAQKTKHSDFTKYVKAKIQAENPKRTNYYLFDSFTRADSTTSLGNAETNNTAWTTATTAGNTITWGIISNSAYVVSRLNGSGVGLAYQETNESDCIVECDLSGVVGSVDGGISFRITDVSNFLYVTLQHISGGNISVNLIKYVGGVKTTIQSSFAYTFKDGKLSVYMKGNKIEVYLDGFLIIQAYDSFNSTATKHGLYSTGGSLGYRWKNLSVKPLGEIPFYINEEFENSLTKWYWSTETSMPHSLTFSSTIKESGSTSLRIELRKDDPDVASSKRSEIKLFAEKPLEEHWYGVSIYLPNGGDEDYANDVEEEILLQWKSIPDSGEASVSPPMGLMTKNGNYIFSQAWDSGRITTTPIIQSADHKTSVDLGSYSDDKGKWVNWVFHVRWGYLDVHDPICEVFKDGVLVYSRKGPNTYNDASGIYQKLGMYKWGWKEVNSASTITKRVIYYDNFFLK